MTLFEEFHWRGLHQQSTEGAELALSHGHTTAYIGFDPTASSLHVGSLLPIMALARLQKLGHTPIVLVGGGTGMIGDPSGKSQERNLLSWDEIDNNAAGMRTQLRKFLKFRNQANAARMLNNAKWLRSIRLLDFLRDTGKHFSVNVMLTRESVKRRVGTADGISFTEFSYQLLQAYDYMVLFERENCNLQMGGSDQWGNIVAGCDLIRRVHNKKVHGLVMPLVTTASGSKFGKTEGGTVWLDPERTREDDFYQFWLQTDDRDVIKYLKYFTWLDELEIERIERQMISDPSSRRAQERLADEVMCSVHGKKALLRVKTEANAMFRLQATAETLQGVTPIATLTLSQIRTGIANTELVVVAGLAKSKSEAFRLIKGGGISINDLPVRDPLARVTLDQALGNRYKVSKGRRNVAVVEIASEPS